MNKLEELKQEAKELGITYNAKIGEVSLQAKIDAFYKTQETSSKEIVEAVKAKEEEEVAEKTMTHKEKAAKTMGELAREMEANARKTKIISIVDNDQRVNNQTTSVTVGCGNEWFDIGQIILPLNRPVETMQGHIDVLNEVMIPMHVKDHTTGLSKVEMRRRYSISEENIEKK